MLLDDVAIIKWNSKNKKRLISLGYVFTKIGDEIEVSVNDLSKGSNAIVHISCDYCGCIYTKKWHRYISENQEAHIHKDSCIKCRKYKTAEYVEDKYGVSNVFQLDDVKEKLGKTNIEKYGVANPFASELIKEKIKKVNLEKYGVEYATQSEIIKEKTKQTFMEKYGTPYSPFLDITHEKGEKNLQWKGGALRNGLFRNTYEYKEWHEAVLKRDNYTCQCCGIKSGCGHRVSIHTHHIYNFASNVDKRFDVDNGICLCKKCHYAFHSAYGFVNTTQEQLDEFILSHGKKIC